jgi:tripartite-type tricarboxylate transporter receptor subunit TctC
MLKTTKFGGFAAAIGMALITVAPVAAQTVEEFYASTPITLMVGAAAGGAADTYARTFATHFGKHVPGNPAVIVENKPGAGGLIVATELQHTAPKDGSVIGTLQRNNFLAPLLSDEDVRFDPREVSHLGSLSRETYVIFTYGEAPPAASVEEAMKAGIVLGGTGAAAENVTYPRMVNKFLGANFNIISSYEGNEEIELAIERGEVDGRASSHGSTMRGNLGRWTDEGKLHILMQFGIEDDPALPGVPNAMKLITDPAHQSMLRLMLLPQEFGRPFAAPKGIPEDRLAALREAFIATANDPAFLADLEKQNASVELLTGEDLQRMADEIMATPPEQIENITKMLAEN